MNRVVMTFQNMAKITYAILDCSICKREEGAVGETVKENEETASLYLKGGKFKFVRNIIKNKGNLNVVIS